MTMPMVTRMDRMVRMTLFRCTYSTKELLLLVSLEEVGDEEGIPCSLWRRDICTVDCCGRIELINEYSRSQALEYEHEIKRYTNEAMQELPKGH